MEKRKTEPTSVRWSGQVRIKTLYKWRLDWRVIPSPPIWSPYILFHQQQLFLFIFLFLNNYRIDTLLIFFGGVGECKAFMRATRGADNEYCVVRITVKSKMRRIRPFFPLKVIFSVMSRLNFAGHFDTLDPSGLSLGYPRSLRRQLPCRPWHDSRCSWLTSSPPPVRLSRQRHPPRHHGLELSEGGGPALLHLLHCHPPETEVEAAHVNCQTTWLARQWWWGLLTEEHLELCQGLRGSCRRRLRGQPKENPKDSKCPVKLSLEMTEKITFSGIKV